jgi:hypothetical protein
MGFEMQFMVRMALDALYVYIEIVDTVSFV